MLDLPRQILRRQWLWMALFFVLVAGVVTAVTLTTPKTYGSEAKLLVRLGRENATLDPTTTMGRETVVTIPASRESDLGSIVEIIRSKPLLEEVALSVGVPAILGQGEPNTPSKTVEQPTEPRPEGFDLAVRGLARGLSVELVKKSSIVQITYEGPSPETAQAVVSAVIERATERHVHLSRNPRAYAFVEEQTSRLRTDLAKQERKLGDLKTETGLYVPEAERQAAVLRVSRLRDELLQTSVSLASVEKETQLTEEQLAEVPANQTSRTTGLLVAGNDALKTQFVTVQGREQELRNRYSANHPEVKLLRSQLDTLKEQLAEEEKKNPREQIVTGPNRLYEDLRQSLLKAQSQAAGLRARQETLREQLAREKTALGQLEANALRLTQQQREVDHLALNYRRYAENFEQIQLDRSLETANISNLSVAQPATFDVLPIRPRLTTNLGIGFGLALVGALALGWLLESLRRSPQTQTSQSPQSSQDG